MSIERTKEYELEYTYFNAEQNGKPFPVTGKERFRILQGSLEGKFIVPEEGILPFAKGIERGREAEVKSVLYGEKHYGVYLTFDEFVQLKKPLRISVTEKEIISSSN